MPTGYSNTQTIAEMATLGKMLHEHRETLLRMMERRIDPKLSHRINAEDILSEAFLLARTKWDWYKRQTGISPIAWLYRISLDCLSAVWRRESRDKRDIRRDFPMPDQSSICLGLGLVQTGTSPSEGAVREEIQKSMRQVMALLRTSDREILWMRHYDQLSFIDIASILQITENAATVRYVRALKKLETLWLQRYPVTGTAE
ncbi:MAG: sigma-70 family RNA polymerase sigma factor [Planctomycetia bacterium]|nr:sigma-70 family RNA polymerase sigma factor [Planctomycetia bacterium]